MTLELLYLDKRVQNNSMFSLVLFLAKFTSTVTATVVLLLFKHCFENGVLKWPGNTQQLYSCRSFALKNLSLL